MRKNNRTLTILQTVAPGYRERFFDYLHLVFKKNFSLFAGNEYFDESIKTRLNKPYFKKIRNVYLFKRRLLLQLDFWKEILSSEVLVLELNPRILTNWLFLILRKLLRGKKTVVWGHAWPRSGMYSKSDRLRNIMRKLADEIIVYTKTQAEELKSKMPRKKIKYAPNALYYKNEIHIDRNILDPKHIIYVGRLVRSKKPLILLKAFDSIKNKLPSNVKLLIVGDGPERKKIENYIVENNLGNRVILLGYIGDYSMLKRLYHKSLFSVSPGYVGLSIIQSFSFGVPMIISKDEPHSPEIEAAIEGLNSIFFNTDSIEDLSKKMIEIFSDKHWISFSTRYKICKFCRDNYSIEKMAKSFLELI